MSTIRLAALAATAVLLCTASVADAKPTRSWIPAELVLTAESSGVVVHYAAAGPWAIGPPAASALGAATEQAIAAYTRLGYPAPTDDGDGKVDVYVYPVPATDFL